MHCQGFHLHKSDSCERGSGVIMTARHELTEFEREMLVGVRRMRYNIPFRNY